MADTATRLASVLDDDTLAGIWLQTADARSPFIDPRLVREAQQTSWHDLPAGWLDRVTGREATTWTRLSNIELAVALRAIDADRAYLDSITEARHAEYRRLGAERAEASERAAQAEWDAWVALRERLPVPVEVMHNWTARHLDGYEQGGDHIVVMATLDAGRLHRVARQPLCETPSRAHELRAVSHAFTDDERRVPNCKACLRHAERIAR